MGRGRFRHTVVLFGFHGVDEVRKIYRVLGVEDRDVVARQTKAAQHRGSTLRKDS